MSNTILTETQGHIFIITLNRPEARNAFDASTSQQMEDVIDHFEADSDLRVAILRANGPTFCAGKDLKASARGERGSTEKRGGFGIMKHPPEKPLIAAIEGQALAGGLELALCCDLIVASQQAVFGLSEVRWNLIAQGGGCFRLPQRIPPSIAMEMALTATPRPAEEMHKHGLVNRLTAPGQAFTNALEIAEQIAANAPLAVKATKNIINRSIRENWADSEAWEKQADIVASVLDSEDTAEGLRAFAEKRQPEWKGR